MPYSSSTSLTESTSECTASLNMAAEPVMTAAVNFVAVTIRLPPRAAQTVKTVLFFATAFPA